MDFWKDRVFYQIAMLNHYFRLFFRKFSRSRTTYLINIGGLSGGLACGLLIYLWIFGELHFDRFYSDADRIYSVMTSDRQTDRIVTGNSGSIILGKALKNAFPEVQYSVATTPADWFRSFSVSQPGKNAVRATGNFVGKDFFHVFPRLFLSGDPNSALSDRNGMAISKSLAVTLFHAAGNAIGKRLTWKWNSLTRETLVTGVYDDFPANSTLTFDFVVPIDAWEEIINASEANADLSGGPFNNYIVLNKGVDADKFNGKIANFIQSALPESASTIFATPFAGMYLHGQYVNGAQEGGRIEYVRFFGLIAICILLIACINFVNLATAKATERMKEIGVRKTLGAARSRLIRQFLGESVLLSFISLAVAVLLVAIVYPRFKSLTGVQFIAVADPWFVISLLLFVLATGIIAGIYPALHLSGFHPAKIFGGRLSLPRAGLSVRKALVLFQFAASLVFIVVVSIVYDQVNFALTVDPGYKKDNTIYFEMQGRIAKDPDAFLAELREIPGVVEAATIGNTIVVPAGTPRPGVYWDGRNADNKLRFQQMPVGYGGIEALGIGMMAGRSFSRQFADTNSIVLNETAVRAMGLSKPLGHRVQIWGREKKIVGVTKDFHFNSLHEKIMPFIFRFEPEACLMMMVQLNEGHQRSTLAAIAAVYKAFDPGNSFDYTSLGEDYQRQYAAERLVAALCKYFAGLSILISCLGLFGLTVFAVEQRIKEIGIRRVLGAGKMEIIYLLSVGFARVVGMAILIGLPISYFVMRRWLNEFAYRIDMSPGYFFGSAIVTFLIAAVTIGIQSVRASMTKPADTLKSL